MRGMNSYTAFLRVRHPTLDPREITQALGLEPAHAWAAGTPRDPDDPAARRGTHTDSYWLAPLGESPEGADPLDLPPGLLAVGGTDWRVSQRLPLESFLLSQTRLLAPRRSFLARLSAEGGSCDLAVTLHALERFSVEFPPALLRSLADLNIAVTIDVSTGAEAASS